MCGEEKLLTYGNNTESIYIYFIATICQELPRHVIYRYKQKRYALFL